MTYSVKTCRIRVEENKQWCPTYCSDRFVQLHIETGAMSGSTVGMIVSLLQNSQFLYNNLSSFIGSNKNYKRKQKGVFGICILKGAPHLMQYKIINNIDDQLNATIYIIYLHR